ncbi:MAG: HAD-IA family hydrolase, partial [Fimbriimonadaceae bacterium]
FDLGGVIVRITLEIAKAAQRAGLSIKTDLTFGELDFFLEYQRGSLTDSEYLFALGEKFSISTEEAKRLHASIIYEEYPGIADLIRALNEQGLKTAILSNTNSLHWEEMKSGRWPAFDQVQLPLGSHEVKLEKPDLAFYRSLEARLEVVPGEIMFFDDHDPNVRGAVAAGWHAHLIDPTGNTASQIQAHL